MPDTSLGTAALRCVTCVWLVLAMQQPPSKTPEQAKNS